MVCDFCRATRSVSGTAGTKPHPWAQRWEINALADCQCSESPSFPSSKLPENSNTKKPQSCGFLFATVYIQTRTSAYKYFHYFVNIISSGSTNPSYCFPRPAASRSERKFALLKHSTLIFLPLFQRAHLQADRALPLPPPHKSNLAGASRFLRLMEPPSCKTHGGSFPPSARRPTPFIPPGSSPA